MVRYFMRVFSFVLLMLPAGLVQASSQQLLDELAQSPSVQAAKPIIDALWEAWTNAHMTPKEQDLMQRGLAAMGQGDFILAESTFGDLVGENPDFTEAWNKRATIRFMMGKFEASRSDVFEVLDREPRHFGAISGLGMIYSSIWGSSTTLCKPTGTFNAFSQPAQRRNATFQCSSGNSDFLICKRASSILGASDDAGLTDEAVGQYAWPDAIRQILSGC